MEHNKKAQAVLEEIEKVVIGKDQVIEKIFMAILASGHVLMEDVPGVGKTTTAMAFAGRWGLKQSACSSPRTPCPRISSAFRSMTRPAAGSSISPARS